MRTATFESTVDILVKAYLNDTLQHENCHACAVGNIVAHSCGYSYKANPDKGDVWHPIIWGHRKAYYQSKEDIIRATWYRQVVESVPSEDSKREIDSTGYSEHELYKIEKAFEAADGEDRMFLGLMNVVDVLAEIHSVDLSIKENAKLLFVKA